jgi:glycosyltransferase involved in cell wall biosynthesis/SAM-dependent methyltransferase
MRLAFFSPLPPARSGIADYSATLRDHLKDRVELTVFDHAPPSIARDEFDLSLYQIGNNPYHSFVYEQALEWPGVVVLHEANLHHLITDLTIRRNDWDAYLREVEFDSGTEALAYAQAHVRTLQRGPDYEGVPMLRRIVSKSRGVIVHSHYVEEAVRRTGYQGPVGVVPHGAWLPEPDRMSYRSKLGLDEDVPLIGAFGFLKPYKRIAESLRALQRLSRVSPEVKMILVGEPHPELNLDAMISSLGLGDRVRVLGFQAPEAFESYLSACDIVLNLRYPTVGETSGTLLRSLGLGKAVIVSDVGAFAEYPDEICMKVPVDATEEDTLFEYLNLLVGRPDLRKYLGQRAREWVSKECNWDLVASRYADFLDAVLTGRKWEPRPVEKAEAAMVDTAKPNSQVVTPEYLLGWATGGPGSKSYVKTHLTRLEKTLSITPPGTEADRVLEMGAYLQITPSLKSKLGYGEVRGCYYGPAGLVNHREVRSETGERFECEVDLFDAEKDRFPYPDEHFATVLCCELLEHLPNDPMHMMAEINRVLRTGGHLVLTTPNIASMRAIAAILHGYHPGFFPAYIYPKPNGETEARHNREYAAREIPGLFGDAGFTLTLLETGPFLEEPKPEHHWVAHMLERYMLPTDLRGDGIYAVGQKTGPVRNRFPGWLYSGAP